MVQRTRLALAGEVVIRQVVDKQIKPVLGPASSGQDSIVVDSRWWSNVFVNH